jgi:CRISPR-associated endonuclease Cas1
MTASPNVSYSSAIRKSGVLVLSGYGVRIQMQAGHLLLQDGIADERRTIRLPRVNHGLKRLVMIGSDGFVTIQALRWLAIQKVAFNLLERDGTVLFTTGPVYPSDARLRRAQALAHQSGAALLIARELIDKKLAGQERVARSTLLTTETADMIAHYRAQLPNADSSEAIRQLESQAASAYWSAWRTLPINFPRKDEARVPDHWRSFGARVSPLTGSPRLAVNPPNAILNFLYTLLESESRRAASVLGLDPGLGVLHADTPARDSLACDLMEAVRPDVDEFLIRWITREPIKREWFVEQQDGNCRLLASFAIRLCDTAPTWGRLVAPVAEWVAGALWSRRKKPTSDFVLPTRLTQRRKREAKGGSPIASTIARPCTENLCRDCGKLIQREHTHCGTCALGEITRRMVDVARVGRLTSNSLQAQTKRRSTQRRNALAQHAWKASSQPAWLTEQFYKEKIQPLLVQMSGSIIGRAIRVSAVYGGRIRRGERPHLRHWQALAQLVGIDGAD